MIQPVITGKRVRLRGLKRADIESIAAHANHRSIARFMPTIRHPYTREHARKWVNLAHRTFRRQSACHFGIERIEQAGIIGVIGLKNLNPADLNAEIEYWLGEKHRRNGYVSEALELILDYAFSELGLRKVYGITVEINERSVALLQRHGFVREAVWRQGSRMDGRWHDVYGYGLLKEEFRGKN